MQPVLSAILDFFYPPLCLGCGARVPAGEYLCPRCLCDCVPLPLTCEQSLLHIASLTTACDATRMLVGWEYEHDGVIGRCIHALKYRRMHRAGIWLGALLGERLVSDTLATSCGMLDDGPVLLPVPLHRLKRIERGYNQSEFLCRGIAEECGIEWERCLLTRRRYTTSQSAAKLDQEARQRNVRDAFVVDPGRARELHGRPLILVDDLVTTGATVSACVDVLVSAGFPDVRILAIARPPRH